MRLLPSLFLALAASTVLALPSACGTPTSVQQDVTPGEPFWLEADGLAVLRDGPTVVRFKHVLADSRCPVDVVCVWAGNARLQFSIGSATGDEEVFELNTHSGEGPAARTFGPYRIELLDVRPPPRSGTPTPPGDYRAQLVITKP